MTRRKFTRRRFIGTTSAALGALAVGCDDDGSGEALADTGAGDDASGLIDAGPEDMGGGAFDMGAEPDAAPELDQGVEPEPDAAEPLPDCEDPFEGGEMRRLLQFEGDPQRFHQKLNAGWDGRLYTDLTEITPETQVISNENFFIRTFYPDSLDPDVDFWTIRLTGMVDEEVVVDILEMEDLIQPMGMHVLECSGNGGPHYGLLSAAAWDGIPLAAVLDQADARPDAIGIRVIGVDDHSPPSTHSTPGASWIFTWAQLEQSGAFLATHMNGEELPLDHGYPVRLYVPGWYGCTNIKWVEEIQFVGPDEPATAQMREFDSRTHQPRPTPQLARDFRPASMDQSAMPVRIEQWVVDGEQLFRVIGILWGGQRLTDDLTVQFGAGEPFEAVEVCPPMTTNQTWTIWQTAWAPASAGIYRIRCAIDDPNISTIRLDAGRYDRSIRIASV